MEVYIVTSGRYSDFGIKCVFSTLEKANAYVEYMRVLDPDINEPWFYEVDTAEVIAPEYLKASYDVEYDDITFYPFESDKTYPYTIDYYDEEYVVFKVKLNKDKSVMEKSVHDQYALYKALKEGIV